jgi:acetylornithine deacetylase
VPRLGAWGVPFLLGPGSIHVAHTPEERIAKRDLETAVHLYQEMVRRLQDR